MILDTFSATIVWYLCNTLGASLKCRYDAISQLEFGAIMQRIVQAITVLLSLCIFPAQAAQLAGEIRSVIGDAHVIASGASRQAADGMPLNVGDVLKTGIGGHIHLRMVDDARISLRPNSQLRISEYGYQAGEPGKTRIRLDLLSGTIRSVTGKGGQQAKDLFRMNTPLAAIGVRGTDFVAQSDDLITRVHVQTGAIVLAPLGSGCLASSLGPCQTGAARTLTAEMQNMMLQFTRGTAQPLLVPLSEGLQTLLMPVAGSAKPNQPAAGGTSGAAPVDSVWQKQPLASLAAHQRPNYQMVWGRWWNSLASGNDLGRTYADAAPGREVTVGNGESGLFRDNAGPMRLPLSGSTAFTLRAAQASMSDMAGNVVAGKVQGGSLGVNFDAQTFSTQLAIQHPALGSTASLNASGKLGGDGMFYSTAALSNALIAGSLSRDGTEAGYQFQMPTAVEPLTGTTLWAK